MDTPPIPPDPAGPAGGPIEIVTTGAATGGGAVGRDAGGRAVFVEDALPGERVLVELTEERPRHARGRAVAVLEAAAGRREPPCVEVARGCGGCDAQHATDDLLLAMKRDVVVDVLRRIGRVASVPEPTVVPLPTEGFRTTVRAGVVPWGIDAGRAGFRERRSHDLCVIDGCLVAHPLAAEVVLEGRFGEAEEVTVRVGARTGERMAVIKPGGDLSGVVVPPDVTVVAAGSQRAGEPAYLHEVVAGRRFRIEARSFFQSRADGADALVAEVAAALEEPMAAGEVGELVDLCAGVGLFAATVGRDVADAGGRVTAVESNRWATFDAIANLSDLGDAARVVRTPMERWRPDPADAVIADPARSGLGAKVVERVAATGCATVVLVSCDAGSLGRDAGLLERAGFVLDRVTLVDLFPHTHHVEVVTRFRRAR